VTANFEAALDASVAPRRSGEAIWRPATRT
jgi:hypothetical protein